MPDVLVSTTPVFKVDGTAEGSLARDLLHLEVEESTAGLKTLQARFLDVGPAPSGDAETSQHLDGSVLDFGKRIEVSLGPPGTERIVFEGRMSALESSFEEGGPALATIFAEDALMKLRMTQRFRTYENVTDADIASAIASEHGLTPSTAADGPSYDRVQQLNMSDLAFLRDRGALVQAEVWAEGDTLNFKTRGNRSAPALTLVKDNQLIGAELRADLAHQRSKVKVSGYDAQARDVIEEEAGGDVVSGEAAGGVTGPATLDRALGERVHHRVRDVPLVSGEATAFARNELLRRARAFVSMVGTTSGSPDLVVGSMLTLERVGPPFAGDGWFVTRVRHTWDIQRGHRTHFEAERAGLRSGS